MTHQPCPNDQPRAVAFEVLLNPAFRPFAQALLHGDVAPEVRAHVTAELQVLATEPGIVGQVASIILALASRVHDTDQRLDWQRIRDLFEAKRGGEE